MQEGSEEGGAVAKWAEVYEALRARILSCELAPGSPVSELTLAKEYNCSPTPVRDALNRLRQEGLIVRESPRRQVVQGLAFGEIRDLCEARAALECACARLYLRADADPSDTELAMLEALARRAMEIGDDPVALVHLNRDFHVALAGLTHNDQLIRMVAQILEASERIFRIGLITLTASAIRDEHLRIVSACRAHDEQRLLELLTEEAANTLKRVSDNLVKQLAL